jgi:hypothetical protein
MRIAPSGDSHASKMVRRRVDLSRLQQGSTKLPLFKTADDYRRFLHLLQQTKQESAPAIKVKWLLRDA